MAGRKAPATKKKKTPKKKKAAPAKKEKKISLLVPAVKIKKGDDDAKRPKRKQSSRSSSSSSSSAAQNNRNLSSMTLSELVPSRSYSPRQQQQSYGYKYPGAQSSQIVTSSRNAVRLPSAVRTEPVERIIYVGNYGCNYFKVHIFFEAGNRTVVIVPYVLKSQRSSQEDILPIEIRNVWQVVTPNTKHADRSEARQSSMSESGPRETRVKGLLIVTDFVVYFVSDRILTIDRTKWMIRSDEILAFYDEESLFIKNEDMSVHFALITNTHVFILTPWDLTMMRGFAEVYKWFFGEYVLRVNRSELPFDVGGKRPIPLIEGFIFDTYNGGNGDTTSLKTLVRVPVDVIYDETDCGQVSVK